MSSLFGPGVMIIFFLFLAALVFLYVMSIFWAKKDAKARGANEKSAMLISLIPFAGVLAYVLMRPPLLLIDKEEQELDIALKRRQLKRYGKCPNCGELVEKDYLVCPKCQIKLKEACSKCGKPLEPEWKACPYCSTATQENSLLAQDKKEDVKKEAKEEKKLEVKENKAASKTDYKIEESFNFDEDAVEEADVKLEEVAKPKHHFADTNKTNKHN